MSRREYWCGYCDGNGYRFIWPEVQNPTPCPHCSGTGHASTNHWGSDDPDEQKRKQDSDPTYDPYW